MSVPAPRPLGEPSSGRRRGGGEPARERKKGKGRWGKGVWGRGARKGGAAAAAEGPVPAGKDPAGPGCRAALRRPRLPGLGPAPQPTAAFRSDILRESSLFY